MAQLTLEPRGTEQLPHELTAFVGRRAELNEIRSVLGSHRLVTITGPGGIGKTRLALRLGRALNRNLAGRVHFVRLSSITDPGLVELALIRALGMNERGGRSVTEQLVTSLGGPQRLLILDNCEQVAEAVAVLAADLLERCSALRLLATSRQALGLAGEAVVALDPMSDADAVELLTVLASTASPAFRLKEQEQGALLNLCQSVDNLPLAIELATRRLAAFTPAELARRLRDSVQVLGRLAGPEERHRSLEATIDWSYRLLSEPEQSAWRRLSVFRGSFSLQSAESVVGADTPALISGLVDRSILALLPHAGGRYRMLETIRQFGEARLAGGERAASESAFLTGMLQLAESAEEALSGHGDDARWLDVLNLEQENLQSALMLACRQRAESALRLALAMAQYWDIRGRLHEARYWLDEALQVDPFPTAARAKGLDGAGWIAFRQNDYSRSTQLLNEAVAIAAETGDLGVQSRALSNLGLVAIVTGDFERADRLLAQSLTIARAAGLAAGEFGPLFIRALLEYFRGDLGAAATDAQASLEQGRRHGSLKTIALLSGGLGNLALEAGDRVLARDHLEEAVRICFDIGDRVNLIFVLGAWCRLFAGEREYEKVLTIEGATQSLREQVGSGPIELWQAKVDDAIRQAREALGPKAASIEAEASRRGLGPIATLFDVDTASQQAAVQASSLNPLTAREREVAVLIADGLGNQAIAYRLLIGARTVQTHVEHILNKLALPNRSAIARWVGAEGVSSRTAVDATAEVQVAERMVTVMFADVRGYTAMMAAGAPAEMAHKITSLHRWAVQEIGYHHGVIDKFAGDAVMATFNVAEANLDHCVHALQSALTLSAKAAAIDLQIGIGIAVGPAVVGQLASGANLSVLGEVTNLASRLQAQAQAGEALLSESAFRRCRPWIEQQGLDVRMARVRLKGFNRPVPVYRLRTTKT